jgi:hypothetical protein
MVLFGNNCIFGMCVFFTIVLLLIGYVLVPVLVVVVPVPMFGMVDCSILGVVYCDCSYVVVALPTMSVYNASVAF